MRIEYRKPTGMLFLSRSTWEIFTLLRTETESVLFLLLIYAAFPLVLALWVVNLMIDVAILPIELLAGFRVRR